MDYRNTISVKLDDDTLDILDKIFSSIFNGDKDTSSKATEYLLRALSPYELEGEYKILYLIVQGISGITKRVITRENFNRDLLLINMDNKISFFINQNIKSYEKWIEARSLDYNLDSSKGIAEFAGFLYSETVRKYDEIMEYTMENSEEFEQYLLAFSNALKTQALENSLMDIGKILTIGISRNRKFIQGADEALNELNEYRSVIEIKYGLSDSKSRRYKMHEIKDSETAEEFKEEVIANNGGDIDLFEDLFFCNLGNKEEDTGIPVCVKKRDILAIIADEGVGKTKLLVEQIFYALNSNKNTLVICTETQKYVMYHMIWARVIFDKLGFRISEAELMRFKSVIMECKDREQQAISNGDAMEIQKAKESRMLAEEDYASAVECMDEFLNSETTGNLTLLQSATYSEIKGLLEGYKRDYNGEVVAIDSIGFLDRDKNHQERTTLEDLFLTIESVANDEGLAFMYTQHTSSDANKALAKGKGSGDTNVRVGGGSSFVSKTATMVWVLSTTQELAREELYALDLKKGRYRKKYPRVLLKRYPECNHYFYDEKFQITDSDINDITSDDMMY